jgi:hypothetical protein
MYNRSHSRISRTPSRGRCRDQTPSKPPARFNKITDLQTHRNRQDLNETSIPTKTNSDPYPPAGNVGSILSAGLTMSIITRGARRGIGPRQTKQSTTVIKAAKQMLLATITTVVFLLMTCWKLPIPLRSLGTPLRPPILPLAPLQQVPTPLSPELDRYRLDGRSDILPREGLTTLTITLGPQLGWTPDARQ